MFVLLMYANGYRAFIETHHRHTGFGASDSNRIRIDETDLRIGPGDLNPAKMALAAQFLLNALFTPAEPHRP
jgi:hypothetical protein